MQALTSARSANLLAHLTTTAAPDHGTLQYLHCPAYTFAHQLRHCKDRPLAGVGCSEWAVGGSRSTHGREWVLGLSEELKTMLTIS